MQLEVAEAASERLYPALFQCFTVIISGYIAGRLNVVTKAESKGIATFVGTFALPSLIFLSLAQLDFSIVNWTFLFSMLLAKGVVFFGVVLVTILVSKPMNLGQAGMFAIFCTQSNDFALGYPIINAIYEKTHPEYALYLYLMAPISLAILNPFAFVLLEINKQRQNTDQSVSAQNQKKYVMKIKMLLQILKGIVFNPVLVMTVLGIIGNIAFKHKLSIYIEGLLEVYGQAFSASALFLLGLRMVGQVHRLKGPALIVPCVLIMVKLIILPVVMRECVSALDAGENQTETSSLSTYAFLYGTIPTAPAVFVFSNIYQLEMDLVASSMVICTFLSAPITFLSAQVITLNKDYADQLKKFGFDLSIVSLFAALWIFIVFTVTRKYKRMPHRITFCLNITQILLAISMIWGGPLSNYPPSWQYVAQQGLQIFTTYSCLLWTCMLSVGLLTLESRGPCFVLALWPVLAFVAWGAPAVMVIILLATKPTGGIVDSNSTDVIRLCLLVFSLTVTTGCLILYIRYRRRSSHFAALSDDLASSPPDESTSLVDNAEPTSHTQSVSNIGCYGAITATPSPNRNPNGCCTNDPSCESGFMNSSSRDLEDIADNDKDCGCRCGHGAVGARTGASAGAGAGGTCQYLSELERAASRLGLLPPEQTRGRGGQLLRHTVLIIAYNLTMFIGVTYTGWRVLRKDESGVYIEIAFFDIAANSGQALIMFALFGLNPQEILLPTLRFIKNKWNGADTVKLPPVEELSFETKHVCEQFITHHLTHCQDAITKDIRWRMRTYRGVFRGSCLVRWLVSSGLATDDFEAVTYGRHLLEGRLISHVNNTYHFTNSPLLYRFN
ncbi:PREDICTED: integral membrane protein GPR155 isoform X2 [Papilio xuthus]|uniref:Integral membrane protein GPR155 isoform X2 n=1 Tax=Papilio xuthus TaxID=66420 RepID=A0AAJ6ZHC9_PAPXU|nr:PREDICTED: integral membrane protein GPR155 isoform X2 [Papilio xuthus]